MNFLRCSALIGIFLIQPLTSLGAIPRWVETTFASSQYSLDDQRNLNEMVQWLDRHGYLPEYQKDWDSSHPEGIDQSYLELKKHLALLKPTAMKLDYIWRIKHERLKSKKTVSGIGCSLDCGSCVGVQSRIGLDWVEMPGFKSAPCLSLDGRIAQDIDHGQGEIGAYVSIRARGYTVVTGAERPRCNLNTDGLEAAFGVGFGCTALGKERDDEVYREYCISAGLGGSGGGDVRQICRFKVFFESKFFNQKWWAYRYARKLERDLIAALRKLDWAEVEKLTCQYRGAVDELWALVVPRSFASRVELTHGHSLENVHNLYMNKKVWRAPLSPRSGESKALLQGRPPAYVESQ
jgi:hypothetical protein